MVGDLRDPVSLRGAVAGVGTVISTANSVSRVLAGDGDLSIRDVDDRGYANLITACEQAGVGRFVYASMLGDFGSARTPFTDAKLATERRLRASPMHEVIVRPDMFQEVWLSPAVGFDWSHGKVTVYGRGESSHAYIGIDDVAEAMVRLALAEDPPHIVEMGGPEAVSPNEAVAAFERPLGRPIKTSHVPRLMSGSAGSDAPREASHSVAHGDGPRLRYCPDHGPRRGPAGASASRRARCGAISTRRLLRGAWRPPSEGGTEAGGAANPSLP